jgi:hypothetical protein
VRERLWLHYTTALSLRADHLSCYVSREQQVVKLVMTASGALYITLIEVPLLLLPLRLLLHICSPSTIASTATAVLFITAFALPNTAIAITIILMLLLLSQSF